MGDPVYLRVGTAFQDSFFYLGQDALRTPVTGKVQGNFAIRLSKDGVGNQSLTGITITEIDAVNNPGEYTVAITSAAFPAAAGHYVLRITDSVNTQFSWAWSIFVTSDGTGAAPIGPALFTPIVGNGRITDGASPILGASIIIRRADGTLYYTTTTDASGLWPAVNFPAANATYTVYAIRSGYQQTQGTITVTGGVAAGPGTDLVMAAAVVSSGFSASDLWAYARRMSRNRTGPTADIEIQQCVVEALERLATRHTWPWYRSYGTFTIYAYYGTGTIALTKGSPIVTLTGGTWPAWVTSQATLRVGSQLLSIASRDSNTQITLAAAWNEASNPTATMIVYLDQLALPSDMYRFGQILPGQRWGFGAAPIGSDQLDNMQNALSFSQKFSDFFAVQGQYIKLSSYPNYDTTVRYSYWRRPATLVNSTDVADWDPAHIRLLRRAIDCEVALRFGGYVGGTYAEAITRFEETLRDAMPNDRTERSEMSVLGSAFTASDQLAWKRRS